jgi:hypothetical protein
MASLIKHSSAAIQQERLFSSTMQVEKKLYNAAQRKQFVRSKKPVEKKKIQNQDNNEKKNKKQDGSKSFKNFTRDREIPPDFSKLNLAPLFSNQTQDQLYEIAASLLRQLYTGSLVKNQPHYKDFEYRILDLLIGEGRKEKKLLSFEKIYPEDRNLRKIYFKMVKGTQNYRLDPQEGYPPLNHFFLLQMEGNKKPIHFCFASTPLLKALFGAETTKTILEQEKAKQEKGKSPPLHKSDLEVVLLKQKNGKIQISTFDDLLSYSRQKPPEDQISYADSKTKIRRKTALHVNVR